MTIQVSNGKGEPVLVPRVVGMGKVAAVRALEKAGLVADVQFVEVEDGTLVGKVVSQVPLGNKEVDVGSTVTIFVGTPAANGGGGGTGPTGPTGPTGATGHRPLPT